MAVERVEGELRCPKCRHGRHISAWAEANIHGHLGPDGLVQPDEIEQHGEDDVYEGSIQCDRHPYLRLERWHEGRWREVDLAAA